MPQQQQEEKPSKLYVVKSMRRYGASVATSVLTRPLPHLEAWSVLLVMNSEYQEPGNYYLEEWRKE